MTNKRSWNGWIRSLEGGKPRWTKQVNGGVIYIEFKEVLIGGERWLRFFQPLKGNIVEIDFFEASTQGEIEAKMQELEHLHDRAI